MDSEQVEGLITLWNDLMDRHARSQGRDRKWGQARYSRIKDREAIRNFIIWCEEREVDPKTYMRARVEGAYKARGVGIKLAALASDVFLDKFGGKLRMQQTRAKAKGGALRAAAERIADDRMHELSALPTLAQEKMRETYVRLGRADLCLIAPPDENGYGYDPRSGWCLACPQNLQCATEQAVREGFDVVALRMGRHVPPVRVIAK